MRTRRYIWFQIWLVLGTVLGIILLVQSILTYLLVSDRLVSQQLSREAARHAVFLERHAREMSIRDPAGLQAMLDEMRSEDPRKIAWIRILDGTGTRLVATGSQTESAFSPQHLSSLFQLREPVSQTLETGEGEVLSTLLAFRMPFRRPPPGPPGGGPQERAGQGGPPPPPSPVNLRLAEIGLFRDSASGAFSTLRRNLVINCSAALALVASMVLIGLHLRTYLRGVQLEQQLELARSVQRNLLPRDQASLQNVDFAAECVPAFQVGGDFYDVFAGEGRVALVLGDVSGKGLPAALLMGWLHGAIRSSPWLGAAAQHEQSSQRLNELLYARTSGDRFASLFWCYLDPPSGSLHYVNAGHPPPFIVSAQNGEVVIRRLEEGGPVLGVLPPTEYRQGTAPFQAEDVLVVYSDGIIEASREDGEEFGEARLCSVTVDNRSREARDIRDAILSQVQTFAGKQTAQDDVTVLVVRARPAD